MPQLKMNSSTLPFLTCPADRPKIEFQDVLTIGLILEIRNSGLKTFALRYRDEQEIQRQHMIGRYPRIGLALARREADRLNEDIAFGMFPYREPRNTNVSRSQNEVLRAARLEVADALNTSTSFVNITAACI